MLPFIALAGASLLSGISSYNQSKQEYKQTKQQQVLDNKAVNQNAAVQRQTSISNYLTAIDNLKLDEFDTEVQRMQTISAARAAAGAAGVNGASYDQTIADITANANRVKNSILRQGLQIGNETINELTGIETNRIWGTDNRKIQKPGVQSALFDAGKTFFGLGGGKLMGLGS